MDRKLKDSRGETLVELLAAILIAALSVALLFTCCMASAEMGRNTREADKKFYEALSAAENQNTPLSDGISAVTASVEVQGEGGAAAPKVTPEICLYGGEEMYSYKKKEAP